MGLHSLYPCFLFLLSYVPSLLSFTRFLLLHSFIQPTHKQQHTEKGKAHGLPFPSLHYCLCVNVLVLCIKYGLGLFTIHFYTIHPIRPRPSSPVYCTLFPPLHPLHVAPQLNPLFWKKNMKERSRGEEREKGNIGNSLAPAPTLALARQTEFRQVRNDAYVWSHCAVCC